MALIAACDGMVKAPMGEKCIPPVTTFAYSSSAVIPFRIQETDPQEVLPANPWVLVDALPDFPGDALPQTTHARILLSHSTNSNTEIWVKRFWQVEDISTGRWMSKEDLLIYHVEAMKWVWMPEQIEDTEALVGDLYLSSDGAIWSRNYFSAGNPQFSVYDRARNEFFFDTKSKEIPYGKVLLSQDDVFWVVPYNDYIYSYDTQTKDVKRHVAISGVFAQSIDIDRDGNLYILNTGNGQIDTAGDEELLRFDHQANTLERIGIGLDPYLPVWSMLVDHAGNLWLDDRGWMTPESEWFQIVRSPIFISGEMNYKWLSPKLIMESSNDLIWYRWDNGMAWLDPQKGSWCWFTTAKDADVKEDQGQRLWLTADGKLYKLSLTK